MKKQFMTHMVYGYPNQDESRKIFKVLDKYSKYIEVQFPFSDPIADGPVIEKANGVALKADSTTKAAFEFVEEVCKTAESKVLIMTYYNIVFNYWVEEFVKKAKEIWVYGFIIPDLPFDEEDGEKMLKLCKENELHLIQIVSPSSEDERLEKISKFATWFVYAISRNMTTWNKTKFWSDFEEYMANLRRYFDLEIWVWFGIKTLEDVEKVCEIWDFSIIGSELIKRYEVNWVEGVEKYLDEIMV